MTTSTAPVPLQRGQGQGRGQGLRKFVNLGKSALNNFAAAAKSRSRPLRAHFADHLYTLCGFSFISASSFVHSLYTGLLITGILLLVLEWKVSELRNDEEPDQ